MRIAGYVLALLLLVLIGGPSAWACSCAELTLPEEISSTAAIFTGKVTKLEVVRVNEGVSTIEVTVESDRVFKGTVPRVVVFTTSDGCCYCASWFDVARSYLFFAVEYDGSFHTGSCSRTKLVSAAQEELAYLEQAGFSGPAG